MESLFRNGIAVAHAAGLNLDPDVGGLRFGYVAFDQFEWTIRIRDLKRAHLRHRNLPG
jgi:hypothetical protein